MDIKKIWTEADLYTSAGFLVFPLAQGGKVPAIKGGRGCHDATDDPRILDAWAVQYPRANLGIATGRVSNCIVIDVDPRNGGLDTLKELAARGLRFPKGPTVGTGNRGFHRYLGYQSGLLQGTNRIGPGVDVKSDGGYVVAPPSFTYPSQSGPGGPYHWLIPLQPKTSLPRLPDWALEMLTPKKPVLRPTKAMSQRGLERFLPLLQAIPAEAYGDWVAVGMSLHAESGGSAAGLALWDEWSRQSAKYRPGECERRWRKFRRSGRSGGTIYHLAGVNAGQRQSA